MVHTWTQRYWVSLILPEKAAIVRWSKKPYGGHMAKATKNKAKKQSEEDPVVAIDTKIGDLEEMKRQIKELPPGIINQSEKPLRLGELS